MSFQPHQSGFFTDAYGSYSALPPVETAHSGLSEGMSPPVHSMVPSHGWDTASHGRSVTEFGEYLPIHDRLQSYPVRSIPGSSHLHLPSVFTFVQPHVGWDDYGMEGFMGQTGTIQPGFESAANTGMNFCMTVDPTLEPVHFGFHPALEIANRTFGTAVNGYQAPSGQETTNGYRVLNGPDVLSSAQSSVYPDDGWNTCAAKGQGTRSCYGEMIQRHLGFRLAGSYVNAAAKSAIASFDRRPTVSMLRSSRSSKQQSTAASTVHQTGSSNTSSKPHRTEAIKVTKPRPRKGIPRLFSRLSLDEHLSSDDLYGFAVLSCGTSKEQSYMMLLGKSKVLATDRITDMVLLPSASESTSIYVKRVLKETVRCIQEAHSAARAPKSETQGVAEANNMTSVSYQKQLFLKAFAIVLMEDLSGFGRSIWVSCRTDLTPQCWNVRMSKFKLRAKQLFEDADFPSDPSTASEQGLRA